MTPWTLTNASKWKAFVLHQKFYYAVWRNDGTDYVRLFETAGGAAQFRRRMRRWGHVVFASGTVTFKRAPGHVA